MQRVLTRSQNPLSRILIVAGVKVAEVLAAALSIRTSANIEAAADGFVALETLAGAACDVILVDLSVRGGFELLDRMPRPAPPVIVVRPAVSTGAELDPDVVTIVMSRPLDAEACVMMLAALAERSAVKRLLPGPGPVFVAPRKNSDSN